jgi:hypothetical protein
MGLHSARQFRVFGRRPREERNREITRMSTNPYQSPSTQSAFSSYPTFAINAEESARVAFIRRTYLHLAGAVGVFALIEAALLALVPTSTMEGVMQALFASRWGWLAVLGGFLVVSFVANSWARSSVSQTMQYMGLGLYVAAESVIFLPILYIAHHQFPGAIASAALVTGVVFGGLTLAVFVTRADFSFLRMFLWLGGLIAMGFILAAIVFQLDMLGVAFSCAMIALAGGYILYDTSNVLHHYRTDQHVAAALALFASVALLFWYILRLFMSRR